MPRRGPEPVRITSAPRSHAQDVRGRTRRYLISMGIRTACVILMMVSIGHWFAWVFLAGAAILPYIAVVMANAGAAPDPQTDFAFERDRRALSDRPADTP